jgi:hypothetical protein
MFRVQTRNALLYEMWKEIETARVLHSVFAGAIQDITEVTLVTTLLILIILS